MYFALVNVYYGFNVRFRVRFSLRLILVQLCVLVQTM
jgi:hypothetical protein